MTIESRARGKFPPESWSEYHRRSHIAFARECVEEDRKTWAVNAPRMNGKASAFWKPRAEKAEAQVAASKGREDALRAIVSKLEAEVASLREELTRLKAPVEDEDSAYASYRSGNRAPWVESRLACDAEKSARAYRAKCAELHLSEGFLREERAQNAKVIDDLSRMTDEKNQWADSACRLEIKLEEIRKDHPVACSCLAEKRRLNAITKGA